MAFTLHGKVQVDNQGMYRALKGMQATVGPMGRQIGQQLRGKMLEAFGVGGGIAIVKKSLQNAFDLRKEAGGLGIATDTLQTLQTLADQTGASVEDMVAKMGAGTAEGDAFAEAVKKMNEQLLEQGRIIDSGTVDKLANTFERLAQLMGRIAPGIDWVVDKLIQLYDLGSKGAEAAVAGAQIAYGKLTGDTAHEQAGREMAGEAFAPSKTQEAQSTPETQARALAAAIAAENRKEKAKTSPSGGASKDSYERLGVSGDTAIGRFFSPGNSMSARETQLVLLNRTVADINSKLATFK